MEKIDAREEAEHAVVTDEFLLVKSFDRRVLEKD